MAGGPGVLSRNERREGDPFPSQTYARDTGDAFILLSIPFSHTYSNLHKGSIEAGFLFPRAQFRRRFGAVARAGLSTDVDPGGTRRSRCSDGIGRQVAGRVVIAVVVRAEGGTGPLAGMELQFLQDMPAGGAGPLGIPFGDAPIRACRWASFLAAFFRLFEPGIRKPLSKNRWKAVPSCLMASWGAV